MSNMLEAFRDSFPRIAQTAFIHPSAVIIGDVTIGEKSSIWPHVTLRGDEGSIVIGDETSIQDGSVVHMTGGLSTVSIGSRVTVGHRAVLHGCIIQDDCLIGMGAVILDAAVIESGSIVGAGAVVPPRRRVAAGQVVVGNPLRVLRNATDADRAEIAHGAASYVARLADYLAKQSTSS